MGVARFAWVGLGLLSASACTAGPGPGLEIPPHTCASSVTALDVAPPRGAYGELREDPSLWCGIPPQGGAPYTPLRGIRVRGPEALAEGLVIEVTVADVEASEELSYMELAARMTCANVGDNEGYWVGSEVHVRYPGYSLDDLAERDAELTVRVTSADGTVEIGDRWPVRLVRPE